MRKKRIMVIGPSNSGKTSLVNYINNYKGRLKKTQDIIYGRKTIDVPGMYLENAWMFKHLSIIAQDASCLLLLVDQSKKQDVYPPQFAKNFRCPVIGVVSKCDLNPENRDKSIEQLKEIGVEGPYFPISLSENLGLEALKNQIAKIV